MDPQDMTCQQLWDYIQDPNTGPLDKASAIAIWNSRCAETFGPWPSSGGTQPPPRPK